MPAGTARTKQAITSVVVRRMVEQAQEIRAQFANEPDPDTLAQAIVCAAPILAASPHTADMALPWLNSQLDPWEQKALASAQVLSTQYSVLHAPYKSPTSTPHSDSPPIRLLPTHLYEPFLHRYSRDHRNRRGVFFTPQPIADYIVTQIDRLLREEFNLPDGLAAHSALRTGAPAPRVDSALPFIIDPACGTGIFLLAVIEHIHRSIPSHRWNAFVPDLLSSLVGIEILPAAAFLAKLNITVHLAATGYDFADSTPINIITGDALNPSLQSQICNLKSAFPVLLGNPPFSSLSTNTNPWIAQLVRGSDEIRGYVRANGQQLAERKTWLHDDYVKFIRLAQWHVEQAGCGIVGFVTNHGYLDNATFRLMRHELLRVFPHIQILDLHGNRKKHEVAPDGARDENVFNLDQGIAISLLCRPPTQARSVSEGPHHQAPSQLEHTELWGPSATKLAAITDSSLENLARALTPTPPNWLFVPSSHRNTHPDYASAWSLADAMPVHTTAPVTARDHFVVAFTRDDLNARIDQFRNLSISDDEIRRRFFNRTRSARYPPGDTRGWKLATARQTIAADSNWQRHITRCLYRPFDWRYIFWHPAMIDWPRTEVTRHLMAEECGMRNAECGMKESLSNSALRISHSALCLIARRQQLPTQPCTFFWMSDGLALDGVIRSDNRGSESLFPLYIAGEPNFASVFVEQFVLASKLTWLPLGCGDLAQTFGPEDLLAYIYALFHSPTYREQHADALRTDFPRVLLPPSPTAFAKVSRFGSELINLHLLRTPHSLPLSPPHPLTPSVLAFRAGGHLALRKWLQPKHRSPADSEYARITAAIARTIELMAEIDTTWPSR